jgi:ribosomal protein L16 Arg81 hydroxylase
MNSQFNAIDYSQQLAAAGVPQAQAEVHAKTLLQALSTCAATEADLAAVEQKLTARMDILEARMGMFEARVMARIEAFEAKVERQLAEMRGELTLMRTERKYDRRLINLVLALQVALIVKAFFP